MSDKLDLNLGQLIPEGESRPRDAIHIAVAPVRAQHAMLPASPIGFINGSKTVVSVHSSKIIGIVDPFLQDVVLPDAQFWMFLFPNTITSLRHHWTHPEFTDEAPISYTPTPVAKKAALESEAWLQSYADSLDESFDDLMEAAKNWSEYGEFFLGTDDHGKFEGMSLHSDFWKHYQIYTGEVVPESDQTSFFTCSC